MSSSLACDALPAVNTGAYGSSWWSCGAACSTAPPAAEGAWLMRALLRSRALQSSVNLSHYDVDRRVDRNHVRQQVAFDHLRDGREVHEGGRPDAPAHRFGRPVGHHVVAF